MSNVSRKRSMARSACLVCCTVLLVLLSLRVSGIDALKVQTRIALWLLQAAPLLAFLPGLWRGTQRVYIWLCFTLLLYFVMAAARVARPGAPLLEVLEIGVIVILFVTAMMFSRWEYQAQTEPGVEGK